MGVTTATVWVCSRCGHVSHLEGGVMPSGQVCTVPNPKYGNYDQHALKPVLVVVPW